MTSYLSPEKDRTRLLHRFPMTLTWMHDKTQLNRTMAWQNTLEAGVKKTFADLGISTLWPWQFDVVEGLNRRGLFIKIEVPQLSRMCRSAAIVMQVVNEVASNVTKPVPISPEETEQGVFARPSHFIILPDNEKQFPDPMFYVDACLLCDGTGVKLSTPDCCMSTFPGAESIALSNADIIFGTLEKIKKLIAQKTVSLSRLQRMIVDEPFMMSDKSFTDMAMILRHPDMRPEVAMAFVGRVGTPESTKEKIRNLVTLALPYWHAHPTQNMKLAEAQWEAYAKQI